MYSVGQVGQMAEGMKTLNTALLAQEALLPFQSED